MKKLLISLLAVGIIASVCATPVFAHHGSSNRGFCPNNGTVACTHNTYCNQDGSCLVDGVCTNQDCSVYGKEQINNNTNQTSHGHGHGHGCGNGHGSHRR